MWPEPGRLGARPRQQRWSRLRCHAHASEAGSRLKAAYWVCLGCCYLLSLHGSASISALVTKGQRPGSTPHFPMLPSPFCTRCVCERQTRGNQGGPESTVRTSCRTPATRPPVRLLSASPSSSQGWLLLLSQAADPKPTPREASGPSDPEEPTCCLAGCVLGGSGCDLLDRREEGAVPQMPHVHLLWLESGICQDRQRRSRGTQGS